MPTVREVEDKYAVGEGFALPDLTGIDRVSRVAEPETVELSATYWDTQDLRLVRNKVTLRRRTGGADEGWHLKLPTGQLSDGPSGSRSRDEVQRPLGRRRTVPPELTDLVLARSRGAALAPVARLETRRVVTRLLDEGGAVLAEIADDTVTPTDLSGGEEVPGDGWREVEVELVDGDEGLLVTVGERLREAGAEPSTNVSKIATVLRASALGEQLAAGPDLAAPAKLGKKSSAADVVRAYLVEHLDKMLDADPRVRLDVPDAVHKMRVATRRLRSTLRTFRPVLDGERAQDLDARLKEIADVLGVPRDREVQLERLRDRVAEQPEELVLGPVQQRLDERLGGDRLRGHEDALTALRSREYLALVEDLLDFVATGVDSRKGERSARAVLPKLVRKAYRRLDRRVALAFDASEVSRPEQDERLHSARKAAKRLRYAAEALIPLYGKDATVLAKRAEDVQEVLGEHQDSVVVQPLLRELGAATSINAGESAFTFGLLAGLEQAAAERTRGDLDAVWARASGKRLRKFLN